MPSKSKSQQRLFCMAYAVRKGDLKRSDVTDEVLKIADGDMTDKELKEFMKLEESEIMTLKDYITERININNIKRESKFVIIKSPVYILRKDWNIYTLEEIDDEELLDGNPEGKQIILKKFAKRGNIMFPKGSIIEYSQEYNNFYKFINVYTEDGVFINLPIGDILDDELKNRKYADKITIKDAQNIIDEFGDIESYEF